MKVRDNRNLLTLILLSCVTCGIYCVWFMYSWIKDINIICQGDGRRTHGVIVTTLLTLLTFGIYGFCWWYGVGNRLAQYCMREGIPCTISGKQLLLLNILSLFCCGLPHYYGLHVALTTTNNLARYHNAYH